MELPEPSFAMQLFMEEIKREKHKDRVFCVIIVTTLLTLMFLMYMTFSYFANSTTIGGSVVTQTAENGGEYNTNNIDQRG